MSTTAHEKNARPYLFVPEGSLAKWPDPLPDHLVVMEVRSGFALPRVIAGIVFAVEDSIVDPPADVDIVYVKKGMGFPVFLPSL